jgi:hypothetical protein
MRLRVYPVLLLTFLVAPTTALAAKVYKWTDPQGNVIYSDSPRPGAIEIEVPTEPAGIVPVPPEKLPPPTASSADYGALIIVSPANNAVLNDPEGNVAVSLVLEPALKTTRGDSIRLRLDGRQLSASYTDNEISIPNVERGEHLLQADVVNGAGKVLITSAPVTFVQERPSQLAPAGTPTGDQPPTYEPVYPPQPYPPTYKPVYPPQPYTPQGQPKPNAPQRPPKPSAPTR